jgi:hypothetical protein
VEIPHTGSRGAGSGRVGVCVRFNSWGAWEHVTFTRGLLERVSDIAQGRGEEMREVGSVDPNMKM